MTPFEAQSSNVNARTVQLVKLLTEVGPDVPEISRRLGQFKESVRYRYKEKILSKGFAVQAAADHEKFGLKRLTMILDFAEDYRRYAQSILASMNELCFLVGFAKTMPRGYYIANFSVPSEFVEDLKDLFTMMKEKGMFVRLEVLNFDWIRFVPMKCEHYDFDTGVWDFDWSSQVAPESKSATDMPSSPTKFDQTDLLIVKELQMDANKSLKEISDKLKVNYKKLAWHYSTHVMRRHLIRGYTVNWMGTRYDYEIEKVLHRQHRYFGVQLIVKEPTEYSTILLRQQLNRLPFLWSESVGKDYGAELTFPVDCVVDGFQYLTNAIADVKERAEIYTVDQTDAASFTLSYGLFDASLRKWTFDRNNVASRFERLIVQIKSGSD